MGSELKAVSSLQRQRDTLAQSLRVAKGNLAHGEEAFQQVDRTHFSWEQFEWP